MIRAVLTLGLGVSVLTGWFVGAPVRADKIEAKTRVKIQDRMILSNTKFIRPKTHDILAVSPNAQQTPPKDISRLVVSVASHKAASQKKELDQKLTMPKPVLLSQKEAVEQKPLGKPATKPSKGETPKSKPQKQKGKTIKRKVIRKMARNTKIAPVQAKTTSVCKLSPFAHSGALNGPDC